MLVHGGLFLLLLSRCSTRVYTAGSYIHLIVSGQKKLMNSNLISEWDFFIAFGAFPATGAIVVLFCFWLTRQKEIENKADWPVSNRFWWILPVGFAVSFAATARLFIVPIISSNGASVEQINFLTVSHGINGAVLGLTLLAFIPVKKRLIPKQPD